MKTTIKQRARDLSKRINEAIKSGAFKLSGGYLKQLSGRRHCEGCALASAAYVFGGAPERPPALDGRFGIGYKDRGACLDAVSPSITRRDAAQLEMGFERWAEFRDHVGRVEVEARHGHPFYKLGRRLRARRDR